MKKYIYPMLLTSALFTAACSNDDTVIETPRDTTPEGQISFSMSDAEGSMTTRSMNTRAGFTGTGPTEILMHIESYDGTSKYRNTRAISEAAVQADDKDYSEVSFKSAYTRYWDDAHGRASKLSVFAVAIPNKSITSGTGVGNNVLNEEDLAATTGGVNSWTVDATTRPTHEIQWAVSTTGQDATTQKNEDLVYANNIQEDATRGKNGRYYFDFNKNAWMPGEKATFEDAKTGTETHGNGCMGFHMAIDDPNTSGYDARAVGKFDKGHLVFNHALSRIQVQIKEGTGFPADKTDDFVFTESKAYITLLNFNYKGTLDLLTGSWKSNGFTTEAIQLKDNGYDTEAKTSRTVCGQVLPGNVFAKNGTTAVMEFNIDHNTYYVTEGQLYAAMESAKDKNNNAISDKGSYGLKDNKLTFQQGKYYKFEITVNKKEVENITAVLVEWSDVVGQNFAQDNTHITVTTHDALSNNGTGTQEKAKGHYMFLKTEALGKIYTDLTYTTSSPNKGEEYQGPYKKYEAANAGGTGTDAEKAAATSWNTTWFYEDNQTAYHLRSINAAAYGTDAGNVKNITNGNTYFEIENGVSTANGEHDYHWGAPFKTGVGTVSDASSSVNGHYKYPYSTTDGYKGLLHYGVIATKDPLKLTEMHMMANIEVYIRTPKEDGASVSLENSTSQTEVTITNVNTKANVDLGIGLVSGQNTVKSELITKPETGFTQVTVDGKVYNQTKAFTWAVVPQPLYRGSATGDAISNDSENNFVGLTIKTPDNNQYYVVKSLYAILAESIGTSGNQQASQPIHYWYPNHKYKYYFTITKKGIENVTCVLAEWSDVIGGNQEITLEN